MKLRHRKEPQGGQTGNQPTASASATANGTPAAEPTAPSFEERLRAVAGVLAPTTVIVAILYYFGYVTTYSWYAYLGINLDELQLSQQDFLLRSVAALYLPAGAILVFGIGAYGLRAYLYRLSAHGPTTRARLLVAVGLVGGTAAALRGLTGIFVPSVSETEPLAMSPLCLGGGSLLIASAIWLRHRTLVNGTKLASGERHSPTLHQPQRWWLLVWGVVGLSMFWATNSVAAAYGRGQAIAYVQSLPSQPTVIVDTTEQLYIPGLDVTQLQPAAGQQFRYRYRELCLITSSGGHIFLIPQTWQPGIDTVIELPDGPTVRLQFMSYRG